MWRWPCSGRLGCLRLLGGNEVVDVIQHQLGRHLARAELGRLVGRHDAERVLDHGSLGDLASGLDRRRLGFLHGGRCRCDIDDGREGLLDLHAVGCDQLGGLVVQATVGMVHAVHQRVANLAVETHDERPDRSDALASITLDFGLVLVQATGLATEVGALEHHTSHHAHLPDVNRGDVQTVSVVGDRGNDAGVRGCAQAKVDFSIFLQTLESVLELGRIADGSQPDRRVGLADEALGLHFCKGRRFGLLLLVLQATAQGVDHGVVHGQSHGLPHHPLLVSQGATQARGVAVPEQVLDENEDVLGLGGPLGQVTVPLLQGVDLSASVCAKLEDRAIGFEERAVAGLAVEHLLGGEDGQLFGGRLVVTHHGTAFTAPLFCLATIARILLLGQTRGDASGGPGAVATLLARRGGLLLLCHKNSYRGFYPPILK